MKKKYELFKIKNKDKVVFIKSGLFYVTYEEDALIVNRITKYKLTLPEYRLGFPSQKFLEIKDNLIRLNISVAVVDKNDITEYNSPNNRYYEVLPQFRRKIQYFKSVDLFLEDLRNKILINGALMDNIKKVVD